MMARGTWFADLNQTAGAPNRSRTAEDQSMDKAREIIWAIEQALRMGMDASDILDENSPIRDAIREFVAADQASHSGEGK
jgi:hypothetical protein